MLILKKLDRSVIMYKFAYQRVSIEDVLNPQPANASTSAVNKEMNDERIYTQEVEASATHVVGMQFTSIEQAYVFYKSYDKLVGFSTRKGGEVHSGGIIITKYFVCSKEGHKQVCIEDCYSKSKKQFKSRTGGPLDLDAKLNL
ncbi:putative transcription factor FAR family [Helianthus annuus]|nr:putative transcription factor FAR family [Helianthus annuus]